ncbi:hypothetical protein BDQ17DRAFT_1433318 [Cyathus striatus]|nr:hypothetical protein BDQ17DRAFT_1433318 [Cyathus striatus]
MTNTVSLPSPLSVVFLDISPSSHDDNDDDEFKTSTSRINTPTKPGISFASNITILTYADPPDSEYHPSFSPLLAPAPPTRNRQPQGNHRSEGYTPRRLFLRRLCETKSYPGYYRNELAKLLTQAPIRPPNRRGSEPVRKCGGGGRREEAAQLLLEGKKGDELVHAVLVLRLGFLLEGPSLSRCEWITVLVVELRFPLSLSNSWHRINSSDVHRAHSSSAYNPYTFRFRRPSGQFWQPHTLPYPLHLPALAAGLDAHRDESDPFPKRILPSSTSVPLGFCLRTVKYQIEATYFILPEDGAQRRHKAAINVEDELMGSSELLWRGRRCTPNICRDR